jgi:hypothetical protein
VTDIGNLSVAPNVFKLPYDPHKDLATVTTVSFWQAARGFRCDGVVQRELRRGHLSGSCARRETAARYASPDGEGSAKFSTDDEAVDGCGLGARNRLELPWLGGKVVALCLRQALADWLAYRRTCSSTTLRSPCRT